MTKKVCKTDRLALTTLLEDVIKVTEDAARAEESNEALVHVVLQFLLNFAQVQVRPSRVRVKSGQIPGSEMETISYYYRLISMYSMFYIFITSLSFSSLHTIIIISLSQSVVRIFTQL